MQDMQDMQDTGHRAWWKTQKWVTEPPVAVPLPVPLYPVSISF
jgi:hypothetical protein